MSYGQVNADVIGTSVAGSNIGAGNASIMKNRIINGSMVIDQRNAGASTTSGTNNGYTLDRWATQNNSGASRFTVQRNAGSITPPVGFSNYLGCTSTGSYTVGSGDAIGMIQRIEGYNIADLTWGTANAKTVTLSFWVYSSLTGTFGGSLTNGNGNYSYPFTYSITSANTWQQISLTFTGPTSGSFANDNSTGLNVLFALGTGSSLSGTAGSWSANGYYGATGQTQWVATNGATFYITGVQLEVGSSATGFEYRIYGTEFANCQRYYNKVLFGDTTAATTSGSNSFNYTTGLALSYFIFPVAMRSVPSFVTTGSASSYQVLQSGGSVACSIVPTAGNVTTSTAQMNFSTSSGLNAGQASGVRGNNSSSNDWIAFNSEL